MDEKKDNSSAEHSILSSEALEAKRKKEKKEIAERREKQALFEWEKADLLAEISTKKELAFLRSLVERNLIQPNVAREIIDHKILDSDEVERLFEKIDEIERIEQIDKILPTDYRPTKEEYLIALGDLEARAKMIVRLQTALRYMSRSYGNRRSSSSIFGNFLMFLSTSLMTVQDNLIDLERALEKSDDTTNKNAI